MVIFLYDYIAINMLISVENEAANICDYIFLKMQKTFIFTIFHFLGVIFLHLMALFHLASVRITLSLVSTFPTNQF